jgi:hypothetical protein
VSSPLDLVGPYPPPPEHAIGQGAEGPCIDWTGDRSPQGYGQLTWLGRRYGAHVVAYIEAYGPIPQEEPPLQVLHACDRKICVNSVHLWLGTNSDNVADYIAKGLARYQRQTLCKRGHPLVPKPSDPERRHCPVCRRMTSQRRRDALKAGQQAMITAIFGPKEA